MQNKSSYIRTFLWLVFLLTINCASLQAAAPVLVNSTPSDGATGVSTTIGITLVFDQAVYTGPGEYYVECTGPGMCGDTMGSCSSFLGSGTNTLTINHTYTPNKNYYLNFDSDCFRNAGMQYWAGISNSTDLNFSTGAAPGACNFTSPCFSPLDNATNVPVESNLTVTFDVPWDYADSYRDFEVRRVSDDSLVFSYPFDAPEVTGAGTTVFTVNPSLDLPPSTALYVNFSPIKKQSGVGQYEIVSLDRTTWNFTTASIFDPNDFSDYISVTIDSSQLNGDLTNYPVFIDLSHFNGTNFFAVVKSDGADIRVTKTDNATLLAREVVVIDTANGTGELHFVANGTLSSSSDTTFHIFYGNPAASEPAANNQFGSENVWINNFAAVWHMSDAPTNSVASVFDSTANHNHAVPQIGTGTMTLAPGRVGLGTYLDNNAFLLIPASATMHPTHTSGTIFSKPNRLYRDGNMNNSSNVVFNKGSGTSYDGFGFGLNPVGGSTTGGYTTNGRFLYVTAVGKGWDDGKYDHLYSSIASQPATSWNIVQATYSDTTGQYNLFQFGLLDNGRTTTGDISATNVSSAIGQSPTWREHDEFFRGIIDEVRYSSTDRSINWSSTEYTNLTCPYLMYSVNGSRPDGYYTLTRGALFPADDATGVSTTGLTLTITYNKEVYPFKGNFYLRRSSDNSIVETIPANHATKISGYGTNTLSIALSSTLSSATSYYVNFDSKAIVDFCGQVATPISNNSDWNFSTAYPPGWLSSNWLNRVKITINASQVNGDLTDFPVFVNLNNLPASFFTNVQNNGSDIRVTLSDGQTMVPIEVVTINKLSSTGELHFRANFISSTNNTEFYIYYNNSNARMINGADVLGAQSVWSNNYVAVYHMQQLPGQGNALIWDSTTNRNHLTPNGSMTNSDLETGKLGSSISFDGTNDFLSASDSSSLDSASGVGQTRTISYWLRTTDAGNKVILEKGTSQNFVEQISANRAVARTNAGTFATSTTTVNDNNWHFVTHTYSGTTNYIFVDSGAIEDSEIEAAPADNNNPLVIGARANSTLPYLGNLDEIRISNVQRTDNWINAEFINQNSPNTFYTISAQEGVNDNSNPKVSTLYPSTQSIQHPIRHPLRMIFNEIINFGNGNINIHNYSNDVLFETIDINNSSRVNGSGTNTIRFTTNSVLPQNTKYYVLIDYGAIQDASSNQYSSIWNKDTWVFTTQGKDSIHKQQIFILDGN